MTRPVKLAKFMVDIVIPFCRNRGITIEQLAERVPPAYLARLVALISE